MTSKKKTNKRKKQKAPLVPKGPNIVIWDIEANNLNANFGFTICIGWKRLGESKSHVISVRDDKKRFKKDPTDDTYVLKTIYPILRDADAWVTWYGKRFDEPFVNSRLLIKGLPLLPPAVHIDGWETCRTRLKLHRNGLASASSFLGLESKTFLDPPTWLRAASGHAPSVKYIEDHCYQDVEVTEKVYYKLRALTRIHPNTLLPTYKEGDKPKCPTCGSLKLMKQGYRYAQVSRTQRYQCNNCHGWTRGKSERIKGIDIHD